MTAGLENAKKTGKRFVKGGEPGPGRPKGSRSKTAALLDEIAAVEAEAIVRKIVEKAKAGDLTAAKLVVERLWPVPKGRPIEVSLPPINTVTDVLKAMSAIAAAVSAGTLSSDEARDLAALIETIRKGYETIDLKNELVAIKEIMKERKGHEPRRN